MSTTRYPGPCAQCGKDEPSGHYTKKLCKNCYRLARRRAAGITADRPKLWEGPCVACGRTANRYKKRMCDTCYKRVAIYKGSPSRRSKYNGPCLNCGVSDPALKYSRKLCWTCYMRTRTGAQPQTPAYAGPCLECGTMESTGGRFYTKLCRHCYERVGGKGALRTQRRKLRLAQVENTLTEEQWIRVLEHFDYHCAYCDKDIRASFTMDHVIPISKGGTHTIDNVVPACLSCNSAKSDRKPPRPVITLKE